MEKTVAYLVIGTLWSLVNMLFWNRIQKIETDVKDNSDKMNGIEHNYLDRFAEVNNQIGNVKEQNTIEHSQIEKNITERITEIEKSIIGILSKR